MEFCHAHAVSTTLLPRTAERPSSYDTMADSKGVGWRKRINPKPKDVPGSRTDDELALLEESDRRRPHGWRKTLHGSRPQTPANSAPTLTTYLPDDVEKRSERSETSTPGRNSKPKLARYTSLLSNIKDAPKEEPELFEPWRSVRTHMINSSTPIPLQHNSGLFRVFEDYRRVREDKERLEALVQDTLQGWTEEQDQWKESERDFQAEIRRLDLLIARGTSGLAGLIKARQGSVIDRARRQHKNLANDKLPSAMTPGQLDREIKSMSKRALLYRPNSPSAKLAAMSTQFGGDANEMPVGTPPQDDFSGTLARKVKSELDLSSLSRMALQASTLESFNSTFANKTGDNQLPDSASVITPSILEIATECDVLIALRELSTLVARRRGLNIDNFVEGLEILLAKSTESTTDIKNSGEGELQPDGLADHREKTVEMHLDGALTRRHNLRKFQSQPHLSSDQKRQRQFSFEPGDDQLRALQEELNENEQSEAGCRDLDTSSSLRSISVLSSQSDKSKLFQNMIADREKPTKIPSPVQTLGRVRCNSNSSLHSNFTRPSYDHRNSRSSVLTAFRKDSTGNFHSGSGSNSRSSSIQNLQDTTDSISVPRTRPGSLKNHNGAVALAAARAAESASKMQGLNEGSPMRDMKRPSRPNESSQNARTTEQGKDPSHWV